MGPATGLSLAYSKRNFLFLTRLETAQNPVKGLHDSAKNL